MTVKVHRSAEIYFYYVASLVDKFSKFLLILNQMFHIKTLKRKIEVSFFSKKERVVMAQRTPHFDCPRLLSEGREVQTERVSTTNRATYLYTKIYNIETRKTMRVPRSKSCSNFEGSSVKIYNARTAPTDILTTILLNPFVSIID